MIIDGKAINQGSPAYVIAEIGHNHQGDIVLCKEMFRIAKECGVDAVKLQKRDNKNLYTKELYNSEYDNENSFGKTYGEHREALEFGWDEYIELKMYAKELGLIFFATAFDFKSVDFLDKLGVPAYKIASGDLNNIPLIKYIAGKGKAVIISTGGGTFKDVGRAYKAVLAAGNHNVCLLQCTAAYPTSPENMNLLVIPEMIELFDCTIGLSDHYAGKLMSPIAYTLGARVFEKHFTLNHTLKGTDHAFSLNPEELKKVVGDLNNTRLALGRVKMPLECESKPLFKMSKKLVSAGQLEAGCVLKENDVLIKSPGDGIPPFEIKRIIGKKLKRDLSEDENITWDCLI